MNNKTKKDTQNLSSFQLLKQLDDSLTPEFLLYSSKLQKKLVLKLLPQDKKIIEKQLKDSKYHGLNHPNVLSLISTSLSKNSSALNIGVDSSWILTEYSGFGDLTGLINSKNFVQDETLTRTLFHQLIEGLEYLHSKGIILIDLSPKNLILSEDCLLKINPFDFEHCYLRNDWEKHGVTNFRAPELMVCKSKYSKSSDIYSAGIILFLLKTGSLPYIEDVTLHGHNLYTMLIEKDSKFWDVHTEMNKDPEIKFSADFKELFESMVNKNPKQRASISTIKKSRWYNGRTYSQSDLKKIFSEIGIFRNMEK